MKILYADSDEAFRQENAVAMEKKFGCKVVGVSSVTESISFLNVNKDTNVIISEYVLADGTADSVYRHMKQNNISVPFVWLTNKTFDGIKDAEGLSSFESDNPKNKYLNKHSDFDDLDQTIASILGVTLKLSKEKEFVDNTKYCFVHTYRMADLLELKHNYFIKEGKAYKQVAMKDAVTYFDVMNNYVYEREVKTFYLRPNDYKDLLKSYIPLLMEQLKRRDLTPEDTVYFHRLGLGLLFDVYGNLGLVPEVVGLIPHIVSGIQVVASKTSNILGIIDMIVENNDYPVELALGQSYLCAVIGLDMNGDITTNVQKLITASILQDLMVAQSPNLAKIDDSLSMEFKDLPENDKNLVKKHSELTIPLLEKVAGIENAADVFNLIRHHHEKPSGQGFPKELSSKNTPPLSCALILSKEIIHRILVYGDQITKSFITEMMTDLKQKFRKDNYIEAFDVIPFKD